MYFEETGAYNKPTNRTILEKLTNSFSDYWFCFIHLFCPLLLGNQHKDYAPPFLTQKYSSFSIHLTNVLFQVLISLAWTTVSQWSTFLSALPPPCLFMHMCVCVCTCVHMHTHVHTHTCTHAHTYTHARVCTHTHGSGQVSGHWEWHGKGSELGGRNVYSGVREETNLSEAENPCL